MDKNLEILERVQKSLRYIEKAWEIEDEWLTYWLTLGLPDGASLAEIVEIVSNDEDWIEISRVGERMLRERED